ncbi:MAG: CinA family protein [Bdellovibrionaceae bacterium]|nr:CinA family protein [Pseudobdellovibrionaceae bacterium]
MEQIIKTLEERGQTLFFAESCTGGKLSAAFVNIPGVSKVFLGSVVAYSNLMKENILGVKSATVKSLGAVSAPTALEMAHRARVLSAASWTISVTGIAGPSGGSVEKPVGTVFFAIVGPGIEEWAQCRFDGDRAQIQNKAVEYAIELLNKNLRGKHGIQ